MRDGFKFPQKWSIGAECCSAYSRLSFYKDLSTVVAFVSH